jgi:hypothetical protein
MFASDSRYFGLGVYTVTTPNGETIIATRLPRPAPLPLAGYHRRAAGDRLDLIAARYLKNSTYFWQLCDSSNTPAPDALASRELIGIPKGPAT